MNTTLLMLCCAASSVYSTHYWCEQYLDRRTGLPLMMYLFNATMIPWFLTLAITE